MTRPVLVVGGDGLIGAAAAAGLAAHGLPVRATTRRRSLVGADRPWLDLDAWADGVPAADAAAALLADRPAAAILCAAVARLEACRSDPARAGRINVTATATLAHRLMAAGVPVIFLSTNQVFDGRTPRCPPDHPLAPGTVYGRTKMAAEQALRAAAAKVGGPLAILRLTKVLAPGQPLLTGWTERLRAGAPIAPFHDMTLAPIALGLVTAALVRLTETARADPEDARGRGLFQLSADDDISYADAAHQVARRIGADLGLIRPCSWADAGLLTEPPARYSSLDGARLRTDHGIAQPTPWRTIAEVVVGDSAARGRP